MKKKLLSIALAAVGMLFAATGTALADPTDLPILPGNLSMTTPAVPDFSSVTLDGTAKSAQISLAAFSVTDARGSGAGWKVNVAASQFTEHNGTTYVPLGKTLPSSSLSLSQPTVSANGTTSAAPSITSGPYSIDSGSAVKIASAAVDAGMGKYDFSTTNVTVSIPSSAYAKTYRSDVTIEVASGP